MPDSVIDLVLQHREPVHIGGAVPIGLLARIVHQPYPGGDREQVFVVEGRAGGRLLVWRTGEPSAGMTEATTFVVRALATDEWRGLLDEDLSVRSVFSSDADAARVTLSRNLDGSGGVTVEPTTVRAEVPESDLPEETKTDDERKTVPHRPAWLGILKGTALSREREEHADEIAAVDAARQGQPAATATDGEGSSVEAFGLHVVRSTDDGTAEVRRHRRQIDALLAVERAGLR